METFWETLTPTKTVSLLETVFTKNRVVSYGINSIYNLLLSEKDGKSGKVGHLKINFPSAQKGGGY